MHREKRNLRGKAHQRGYDRKWHNIAAEHKRQNPCCAECLKKGFVVAVQITDHIIPVHVRPDLMYQWSNLQSLCRACHTVKTNEDVKKYGAAR